MAGQSAMEPRFRQFLKIKKKNKKQKKTNKKKNVHIILL